MAKKDDRITHGILGDIRPKPGTEERSEEHTSELQSQPNLVCRLLLEKKTVDIRSRSPRHRRLFNDECICGLWLRCLDNGFRGLRRIRADQWKFEHRRGRQGSRCRDHYRDEGNGTAAGPPLW